MVNLPDACGLKGLSGVPARNAVTVNSLAAFNTDYEALQPSRQEL
jgi:hypothetical protein